MTKTKFIVSFFLIFFSSDSGYVCMVFHKRDQNVVQMRYGKKKIKIKRNNLGNYFKGFLNS